ncbi:MAG: efflux RND transporter periplasmic adaptor subunit [Verrucomicrobia bacterium]|nr:efflux RND transporter periplasmic adaptor subunit [Verrucomicrobiota bacterium]
MKIHPLSFLFSLCLLTPLSAADAAKRSNNTVVLDSTGVQNLRIQTAVVEPGDFEETIFTLGRIEAKPGSVAAVTSRISGRVVALSVLPGDRVAADAEVLKVESRQVGNPSPVIVTRAPSTGVLTRLDVRLGDPVEPDRALLEITDLSEVVAVARVPENLAGRIKAGALAHIAISALPEAKLTGRLLRMGTAVDQASGTLDALFILSNPDGAIRPGMRCEFSIVTARRTDVTSVPRGALQGTQAGRFVYVKDFDLPNAFVKSPVVVGQSNDRFVEIISGLLPADEVVTQGAYSLAFAGGGSVSLKEALDAAHGHEHNADGSEITDANKKNSGAPASEGEDAHDHGHAHENPFWMIVSGVLFIALLFVGFRKKTGAVMNEN